MSKLLFLGDWYINDVVDASDPVRDYPFIINLEAPISKRGKPTPGKISLRIDENKIFECFGRIPTAVCLGNNHIFDYGIDAFEDTLNELASISKNLVFFGADETANDANSPVTIQVTDQTVALLSYVCSSTHPIYCVDDLYEVKPINLQLIYDDIRRAKIAGASRIVVSLHWGAEEILLPKPSDIKIAHKIIDQGVDLIIGHHAHVPQPVEIYNGKPIAYGLGNFAAQDLQIPVYDDQGNVSRVYKKKQFPFNKTSLGLIWDVRTGELEVKTYHFDGHQVKEHSDSAIHIKSSGLISKWYASRFSLHVRKRRLTYALARFSSAPKPLTPRRVWALAQLLVKPRI